MADEAPPATASSAAPVVALPRRLSEQQRALVTEALSLVERVARRLSATHGFDFDECVSVGELALTEAVFHYQPSTGIPFHVFAFLRVRGEILDTLGRSRKLSRIPVPTARLGPLASELTDRPDPFRDSDDQVRDRLKDTMSGLAASFALSLGVALSATSAEDAVIDHEHTTRLKGALDAGRAQLSEEQRELLRGVYDEGLTLKELEPRMKASYRTLRRRHQEALTALGTVLRAQGVHHP